MEDSRIIALLFERSEQALSALGRKYGPAVMALAGNILGNRLDAEECADDTWLGVWNTVPPQYPEHLKAYTLAITRNLALSRYHANTAQKRNSFYDAALEELEDSLAALETVETEYDARELTAAINCFLDGLSYDDRFLFLRRYWYADGVSAIGAMMGLSPHRVSVRLFRIRERLERQLVKEGILV